MISSLIFRNKTEDFIKIYAISLIAFSLSFYTPFLTSPLVLISTVYLLDSGHVYTTMLEVYADPEELRKPYVWYVTLGSFILNAGVLFFFGKYFFYYIFYFTVFHNMRQGLGVTFLHKKGEAMGATFYKMSYYFLTLMPFLLFHLRPRLAMNRLSEAIIRPFELSPYFSWEQLARFYQWGLNSYLLGIVIIFSFLIYKKYFRGLITMIFFFGVYVFAFLLSKNEFQSYILLIFSHAIPYFFLMQKRIVKTHSLKVVKKYAGFLLITFFILGGSIDYFQNEIAGLFSEVDLLIRALLATPLIAHFIFDAIIWKRGNDRFQAFLDPSINY